MDGDFLKDTYRHGTALPVVFKGSNVILKHFATSVQHRV